MERSGVPGNASPNVEPCLVPRKLRTQRVTLVANAKAEGTAPAILNLCYFFSAKIKLFDATALALGRITKG